MEYKIQIDDNQLFLITMVIGDKKQELSNMFAGLEATDAVGKRRQESAKRLYDKYQALYDSITEQVIAQRGGVTDGKI